MPHITRTKELVELLGAEDYKKLLSLVEKQWPILLKNCSGPDLAPNLHQMKSMSYSAGFDDLGEKIKNIENMVKNGAYETARSNIETLNDYFETTLKEIHSELEKTI